jgi:iron complex transport system substrate-binding protein
MRITFFLSIALTLLVACGTDDKKSGTEGIPEQRIISLSGAITETLYELGYGANLVGVDVTSTYPAETAQLPKVGHVRSLNAEGLLSLKPTIILAETSEFNSPALKQLEASGIRISFVEKPFTLDAPAILYSSVAKTLGVPAQNYQGALDSMQKDRELLADNAAQLSKHPKIVFIYSRAKGQTMLAGKNTAAAAMIDAVGGINPLNDFEDFRAFSQEGLMAANPDVLLLFSTGKGEAADWAIVEQIPGVAETNAGKNKHIIFMDGNYVLGFGPRCVSAALEFQQKISSFGY